MFEGLSTVRVVVLETLSSIYHFTRYHSLTTKREKQEPIEHDRHMMRTRNYDLPSLQPGCDKLEKLFAQASELKNRFNKDINPDGLALFDLLSRMLDLDPEKRPTPDEVLKHSWCNM